MILLIAACVFELKPLLGRLTFIRITGNGVYVYQLNGSSIGVLITGPGIMNTAYHLGRIFALDSYEMAINAGICGSYSPALPVGKVMEVVKESITDLGAEEENRFSSLFDLGLVKPDAHPYHGGLLMNPGQISSRILNGIPKAKGATVNAVPGKQRSSPGTDHRYIPDTESMEGAAFFYACLLEGIPFSEIRAISNLVEERDKTRWEINPAVHNLNNLLFDFLSEQSTEKH